MAIKRKYRGIPAETLADLNRSIKRCGNASIDREAMLKACDRYERIRDRLMRRHSVDTITDALRAYRKDLRLEREKAEAVEAALAAAGVAASDDDDQGATATVDVSSGPETAEDEPAQSAQSTSQGANMSFWSTLAKERTKRIEARADSRARRAEAEGGRGGGKRRAAARRAEAAEAAAAGFGAEALELERLAAEEEAAAKSGSGMPSWLIPAAIAGVALFALRK
jgi:hypothetical protein